MSCTISIPIFYLSELPSSISFSNSLAMLFRKARSPVPEAAQQNTEPISLLLLPKQFYSLSCPCCNFIYIFHHKNSFASCVICPYWVLEYQLVTLSRVFYSSLQIPFSAMVTSILGLTFGHLSFCRFQCMYGSYIIIILIFLMMSTNTCLFAQRDKWSIVLILVIRSKQIGDGGNGC